MMFFTQIQSAFDSKLAAYLPALSIAWENTKYVPVLGTSFVRPQLNLTNSDIALISERQHHIVGNYIIDIFTQAEKGTKASNELAGALFGHFNNANELSISGANIFIGDISKSSSSLVDNWWRTTLTIEFQLFK